MQIHLHEQAHMPTDMITCVCVCVRVRVRVRAAVEKIANVSTGRDEYGKLLHEAVSSALKCVCVSVRARICV
jgi:hypothetical protein